METSFQQLSVIVPENPFAPPELRAKRNCLCALPVDKLMRWWPGVPHSPNRDATKVKAIQRSLDWKRVASIAAYLLQQEVEEAAEQLDECFRGIYEPQKNDPGREWPPRIPKVVSFQRSEFPTFSNILLHINGAEIHDLKEESRAANLSFDENDKNLSFSVIDGQHRVNGAYFALWLRKNDGQMEEWQIPAEVFLDLDKRDGPPRRQAQIFIDVNFYQKKVDRSLAADLFPTARGAREPLDTKERAMDIGRMLMLEKGPLVGMVQIPGIRYGVKDVIALATLNGAIEDVIPDLDEADLTSLNNQADFIAQCLEAWLQASGRLESSRSKEGKQLDSQSVVYQGRVLGSVLSLLPAMIWRIQEAGVPLISERALDLLTDWLREVMKRVRLIEGDKFVGKDSFKKRGYLGSGGIGRFRNAIWAGIRAPASGATIPAARQAAVAEQNRAFVRQAIGR